MEEQYLALLQHILENGTDKTDRTGVGTRSIFGAQLRFDLNEGFPLLTTKRLHTRAIFAELCWLIRGETNIKFLHDRGCTIWDEWADENGDLGPVYGKQWRDFNGVDQLRDAIDQILVNPDSRRIVVSAWNPVDVPKSALPPCHMFYQFEVHDNKLSCHMYMRSADMFLGVPFNIASYAALTQYIAQVCKIDMGELVISFGDVHIYNNHFEQVKEQLSRVPRDFPKLRVNVWGLDQFLHSPPDVEDFEVIAYDPHPSIKADVAV